MIPIFSENFLSQYISDFNLSSIPKIRDITSCIDALMLEISSGKIASLKEEEISSRFIDTFFGDVLGFNYGNSNTWQLRLEKKSSIDGKKADGVLGFFTADKTKDDVRALIELKSTDIDLDGKQSRPGSQSPVEQAFGYAKAMGGNCRWVIVSNITEIRFYPSLDISRCQRFFFNDLLKELKLKELLLLFHKDRFIKKEGRSATDILFERSKAADTSKRSFNHILDQIYFSLKRFEGFGFVDPNYIASIKPFNIFDENVWHYEYNNLLTNNSLIYDMLVHISIANNEITFNVELQKELAEADVLEPGMKIAWIFKFLNHCMIFSISAVKNYKDVDKRNKNVIGYSSRTHFGFTQNEGLTRNIFVLNYFNCNCTSCQYRTFDFDSFLKRLKEAGGHENANTAEYAYGNYLVASDNFKTTYTILKNLAKNTKGIEGKEVEHFLARQNMQYLHNLISDYGLPDRKQILMESRSVDLDKVIYDEIEFSVDDEVKRYLIKVKEDELIYKVQDKIEEVCDQIADLDRLYKTGGTQSAGPDLPRSLIHAYLLLYHHVNGNYIIYDVFRRYRSLSVKVFRALVVSHLTPEYGLEKFDIFLLTEAIIHVDSSHMKKVLSGVKKLKASSTTIEKMLIKLTNFLNSYYRDTLLGNPQRKEILRDQFSNYRFRANFTDIFSNIFSVLSRLEVSEDQFQAVKKPLLKFLEIEEELSWSDLKELGAFIDIKGNLFEATEMETILKIAVERDSYGKHKYKDLTEAVCYAMRFYHPGHKISNTKLIKTAILNCTSDDDKKINCINLVPFIDISDDQNQKLLTEIFERQLDKQFSSDLYHQLLWNGTLDFDKKNYLEQYSEYVNLHKGGRAYKYGELELTDLVFINYIAVIYKRNIGFDRDELRLVTNVNGFESWLLDPAHFDYASFEAKWLTDIKSEYMLNRLKKVPSIKKALDEELQKEFDPVLAKLRHEYFC